MHDNCKICNNMETYHSNNGEKIIHLCEAFPMGPVSKTGMIAVFDISNYNAEHCVWLDRKEVVK